MNIVDIEQALFEIANKPYKPEKLGLEFVSAFAKSSTTVKRLKVDGTNDSDVDDGLLWRGYMHYAPATQGMAANVLEQLKQSKASIKHKVRLLIATDGHELLAFDRKHGDLLCTFLKPEELSKEPAFFFPLAGLESFKSGEESIIDIKATGKLAKLYDALITNNPDWESHRHELNHFMTQIIFCLFAEDANIFEKDAFTKALTNRAGKNGEHVTKVIKYIFSVLDIPDTNRNDLEDWVKEFRYVNGGLFRGNIYVPKFDTKSFRLLLDAASIDWSKVNPDILGSSIQAIVDPTMRSNLGMHYTSVQNILKTISPLFLDELREELFKARYSKSKLLSFLKRLSKIKVFDPACGSGNFLVIAYREMRKLEMDALDALQDIEHGASMVFDFASYVRLSQFYGIEYTDFAAETAKLALWIAAHQANARFNAAFGAKMDALPLVDSGNILHGNALRVDWNEFCPGDGAEVKICGNPPYLGSTWMNDEQKEDMRIAVSGRTKAYKSLDYVCAWFFKATGYCSANEAVFAFVATNSIVQGSHVAIIWPVLSDEEMEICFAHTSFKWKNYAANNAGVTCVIIGMRKKSNVRKIIFDNNEQKVVNNINGYLLDAANIFIEKANSPLNNLPSMEYGNKPVDDGCLIMTPQEASALQKDYPESKKFIRKFVGSRELIQGIERYCLWIDDKHLKKALQIKPIKSRIYSCKKFRLSSRDEGANKMALRAHQFRDFKDGKQNIVIPSVSSENREYLPVDILSNGEIISNASFAIYDGPIFSFALIASKMHFLWIATVCGKLKTDFRYSNTLGWHTFPVPEFTKNDIKLLEESAKGIILAREKHFPATIAHLYDPKKMPENLCRAHEENDRLIESLYRKKPFEDNQERLAYLFELYSKMVARKNN